MRIHESEARRLRDYVDVLLARLSGFYDENLACFLHKACRIRPHDLIVGSFERSGRTWVRFFVAAYLSHYYRLGIRVDWNNFVQLTPGTMRKKEGLLACPLPVGTPRAIFSHRRSVGRYFPRRKVVYITRNFLDILVSYYFFHKHRPWATIKSADVNEFVTSEFNMKEAINRINYFSKQLAKAQEVLILRYEYLNQHPEEGFTKLIEFTNYRYDSQAFSKALEHARFASMRKMEVEHIGDGVPERFHTRRGDMQDFRNHLQEPVIKLVGDLLERQLVDPLKQYYLGR